MRHPILLPSLLVLTACGGGLTEADVDSKVSNVSDDLDAHASDGDAHHAPTTDASDLTSGTLSLDRLPGEVATDTDLSAVSGVSSTDVDDAVSDHAGLMDAHHAPHGLASFQQPDFNPSVDLDSTVGAQLASVAVTAGVAADVHVVAHVYVEKTAASTGRYELWIAEDGCSGPELGATLWRPQTSVDTFHADVLTLTDAGSAVDPGSDVVLCGAKFDAGAPDATVGYRGMLVQW